MSTVADQAWCEIKKTYTTVLDDHQVIVLNVPFLTNLETEETFLEPMVAQVLYDKIQALIACFPTEKYLEIDYDSQNEAQAILQHPNNTITSTKL